MVEDSDDDDDIVEMNLHDDEDDIVELTHTQDPAQLVVSMQQVEEMSWAPFYLNCPTFGQFWKDTHDPGAIWPEKIKIFSDRMYHEEKLCSPTLIQKPFLRLGHDKMGHVGAVRLWLALTRSHKWADEKSAKDFCNKIARQCETCQACVRGPFSKGPVDFTPIPSQIMSSVAIDLFFLPATEWEEYL